MPFTTFMTFMYRNNILTFSYKVYVFIMMIEKNILKLVTYLKLHLS
jgi:hypothetical protein